MFGTGVAGQLFAISPFEPLELNYYVYFMNTASSSRSWGVGKKTRITSLFGILNLFFCPPHELIYGVSPCEPLRLNYHLYFMNSANSSRFKGAASPPA